MSDKELSQDQNPALAKIAKDYLGLTSLHAQNSDRLDFKEHAVWNIRDALAAAYEAGRKSVHPNT